MKINFNNTKEQLWKQTPCTIPFIAKSPVIDRTPRFNLFSIYHKDDVNKPKKVFSEFQKPELLLINFRKQIQEATYSVKYAKKVTSLDNKVRNKLSKISNSANPQPSSIITSKLYKVPQKLQFKHDRFGNRSNLVGEYDVKNILAGRGVDKKNFTSGRRTDFQRPHNFYPGPGTYFRSSQTQILRNSNYASDSFQKLSKKQTTSLIKSQVKIMSENKYSKQI